jgi:uncharacterized membrane protein
MKYPRARLDALSDGIFAVAMTLLVLDVRLPDEFQPHNARELLDGLRALAPKFLPYALSFLVLGLRWLSTIQVRSDNESLGKAYTGWWLVYLLLITCVPFTTIVLGRFSNLAPAVWLYAGNAALLGIVSFAMMANIPDLVPGPELRDRRLSLAVLIASSLLMVVVSLFDPRYALWAFTLNLAAPLLGRRGAA